MSLKDTALQILGLIDLTSLNDNDTEESIRQLCKSATTDFGSVPAICIFSQFIPSARKYFKEHGKDQIKIATVANFPHGESDLKLALKETETAIELGADEVDIVFPYQSLISGNHIVGAEMVKSARSLCGHKTLKVIIESGILEKPDLIELASDIAIANGADFIKTSTGKVKVNATLSAAKIMLNSIKKANTACGFKASGGIRKVSEAHEYLTLTAQIMGESWINANNFRFGASGLLTDVINILADKNNLTKSTSIY